MSKTQVTFLRNVKFNGKHYTQGAKESVNAKDFEALDAAKAIDYKERPVKETNASNFAELNRKDLEKVKNNELKAYLEEQGVEYAADVVKTDLIDLILGSAEKDDHDGEAEAFIIIDAENEEDDV